MQEACIFHPLIPRVLILTWRMTPTLRDPTQMAWAGLLYPAATRMEVLMVSAAQHQPCPQIVMQHRWDMLIRCRACTQGMECVVKEGWALVVKLAAFMPALALALIFGSWEFGGSQTDILAKAW